VWCTVYEINKCKCYCYTCTESGPENFRRLNRSDVELERSRTRPVLTRVLPLLKKSGLNSADMANFRPDSNVFLFFHVEVLEYVDEDGGL